MIRSRPATFLARMARVAVCVSLPVLGLTTGADAASPSAASVSAVSVSAASTDSPQCQLPTPSTFHYVGNQVQQCTVPSGTTSLTVTVIGAQGGSCTDCGAGGNGGEVVATLPVTPGQKLGIWVGQQGTPEGGWGWPASGGNRGTALPGAKNGAGGGGASGVAGSTASTAAPLVVAGGGGGGGGNGEAGFASGTGGAGGMGGNPAGKGATGHDEEGSYYNRGYGGSGGAGGAHATSSGGAGESSVVPNWAAGGGGGGGFGHGGKGGHKAESPYSWAPVGGGGGGGGGGGTSGVQSPAKVQVYTTATTGGNGSVTLSTATVVTENCNHSTGTFPIPANVSQLQAIAVGGQGGSGSHTGQPGYGAQVTATIHLNGQKELSYQVGCQGYGAGGSGYGQGGWQGSSSPFYDGEGGGGGTAVFDGNGPLVVAGGGGGPGGNARGSGGNGGNGGYGSGSAGAGSGTDGSGASEGHGGAGGAFTNISGQGGADGGYGGAGGGGGGGYTPAPSPGGQPGGGGLQGTNGSPEAAGGGGGGAGASYARPGVTTAVTYGVSLHPGNGFLTLIYQVRVPTHVKVAGGSGQSTVIGSPFGPHEQNQYTQPLQVTVTDQFDAPFAGLPVTFATPSHGPSGTFANGKTSDVVTTDSNGMASSSTLTANQLAGGPWTATAQVGKGGPTVDFSLTNDKAATYINVAHSPTYPVVGQSVHLWAAVAPYGSSGPAAPTGDVQFGLDGHALGAPVPVSPDGATSAATSPGICLALGPHTMTAHFLGSSNDEPSATTNLPLPVLKASTITSLTSSADPSVSGQAVKFTATVKAVDQNGTPDPTAECPAVSGRVQFVDQTTGTNLGQPVMLVHGAATSPPATLAAGAYSIAAIYQGTLAYSLSYTNIQQVVRASTVRVSASSSANPSKVGEPVTFKAAVTVTNTGSGAGTANQRRTVQFVVDGTSLGTPAPVVDGTATSPSIASLTPGSHDVQAVTNEGALGHLTQVVEPPTAHLQIVTSSSLPVGTVGVSNYYVPLKASGGNRPYHWSVLAGQLPPGLSLRSATVVRSHNLIFGTPTTAGVYDFTIMVSDSTTPVPFKAARTFQLTVTQPSPVPTVGSVMPQAGPGTGGTTVTITGTNLPTSGATVMVGSTAATNVSCTATTCTATMPAGTGTQDVVVSGPSGSSTLTAGDTFLYVATTGTEQYQPLTPYPVLDTVAGQGAQSAPLGPGSTIDVQVTGTGTGADVVPASANAAVLDVTEYSASETSQLTAWPAGQPRPTAPSLTFGLGQVTSSLLQVPLSPGGTISLYNEAGFTNVAVEVEGYLAPATASSTGPTVTPAPPAPAPPSPSTSPSSTSTTAPTTSTTAPTTSTTAATTSTTSPSASTTASREGAGRAVDRGVRWRPRQLLRPGGQRPGLHHGARQRLSLPGVAAAGLPAGRPLPLLVR